MGWASGSYLLDEVFKSTLPYIPQDKKDKVIRELIAHFQGEDCDTIDECRGNFPEVDKVIDELYHDENDDNPADAIRYS